MFNDRSGKNRKEIRNQTPTTRTDCFDFRESPGNQGNMATEGKSNMAKSKPNSGNQAGLSSASLSSKAKVDSSTTKSKAVATSSSSKQSVDVKQKSVSTTVSKTEVKAKATSSSSKTVAKTVTQTRQKKVYSLPGQKYDVPEEREPLRIFYESLSKQIPSSEMAEFWMMERGLLSPERAKKAFEKKQRKQKQLRTGTPIKSPPPSAKSKPESSKKPQQVSKNGEIIKAKKRIIDESDDDDFVLSHKRRKG